MKSTSHGEYLTRITKGGFVNCFLVRDDDGFTLVDTMLPKSEKGILEAAESLGAPIVRIALTHAHQDHAGSVDALNLAHAWRGPGGATDGRWLLHPAFPK